jgi:hypothetical protein
MNTPHLKFQMSAQHVADGFVFYVLVLILKNLVYIVYPFGAEPQTSMFKKLIEYVYTFKQHA